MNKSYWQKDRIRSFTSLKKDIECDVLIIGGGLSGISIAHHLNDSGLQCVVVDKDCLASHTSSHTSAKVTILHGLQYINIAKKYGNYYAYLYYRSNIEAYNRIKENIKTYSINCEFEYCDSYIYSDDIIKQIHFQKQKELFKSFKIPFLTLDNHLESIGLKEQAIFNPVLYILGLIQNCHNITFFEQTLVTHIKKDKDKYQVKANGYNITCQYVVHATRYPFIYKGLFFTKMYQAKEWVSYKPECKEINSLLCMDKLYSYRKANNGCIEVKDYGDWYAMDTVTYRHIPYIGRYKDNEFVVYGFAKWGMTLSEVAGLLISDLILNKNNVYEQLYNPIDEDYSFYKDHKLSLLNTLNKGYVKGRFQYTHLDDIQCNEGGIIKKGLKLYAVYKDENGICHYFSPYCRHVLCLIRFDKQSKTWVCPCHGSVYDCYGEIIEGPTSKCLKEQKE